MPDVVMVGGGVIGLSAAWRMAGCGLEVVLVDPAAGRGASWVAAGMLAPVTEATYGEEDLVRLLVTGAGRWPGFATELEAAGGVEVAYQPCGTVLVAVDTGDRDVVAEMLAFQQSLGLEVHPLAASQCRRLVPALAPGIRGGAEVPIDHQVDNRRLVEALLAACHIAGVQLVEAAVEAVVVEADGAAGGVRLDDGSEVAAGAVVLCAGCHTSSIGGLPKGVLPPVRPVKGHILRLRGPAERPLLPRTVRGLVHGRACYLVPRRDGTLVVGATVEERGFDTSVQAGAVHGLLDDARTLVPGVDELELVECQTGLRPGSPDNAPFVGWTEVDRLAVAAGHYRNGILLAPLTAEVLVALMTGGTAPPGAEALAVARSMMPRRALTG